jgi:iron uptake system component EfeO
VNTSGTVNVGAKEFAYHPAAIAVKAGTVTFKVKNTGVAEHEFEIFQGSQVIDEIEGLVPGLEKELKVDLAPGDYTIVCKLPGHEEAGMKATLTVVAA